MGPSFFIFGYVLAMCCNFLGRVYSIGKDTVTLLYPRPKMTIDELLSQFNELSVDDRKSFLEKANASLKASTPSKSALHLMPSAIETVACPYCHTRARRHGYTKNGSQRYFCPNCHRSFLAATGTLLEHSRKPKEIRDKFVQCMMERKTIRESARTCGICTATAFVWRHKYLDALQSMMASVKMDGVVEADEAFFRLSFKGDHRRSKFVMPREAHRRGNDVHTRGLSSEQVCVPTAVTRQGLSVGKVGSLGTAKREAVMQVLEGHIEEQSTLCTDSLKAYGYLATLLKVRHVAVETGKHMRKGLGIQCVNAYHTHLKSMVEDRFRGVATKYLNNYIVWYNFVGHAKGTMTEKASILAEFIKKATCRTRFRTISQRNPIPVLA